MQSERPDNAPAVSLDLTIPGDTRYRETVRILCVQMSKYAGYADPAAREIGVAVDSVLRGIIDEVYGRGEAAADGILLSLYSGELFRVEIRYGRKSAETPAVDERLQAQPEGRALLTYLRGAMDRVEFGCENAACYCRLTCRVPEHV